MQRDMHENHTPFIQRHKWKPMRHVFGIHIITKLSTEFTHFATADRITIALTMSFRNKFPREEKLLKEWLKRIGLERLRHQNSAVLCSDQCRGPITISMSHAPTRYT